MENKRQQWGSNFGFIMAAVGSAVGLGNIWGFPYKMGANGGFAFLLLYLVLAALVGFIVMLGEIALGRKTGKGAVGTYIALSKKFKWLGWFGVASAFLIMGFYTYLGGFTIKYAIVNVQLLIGQVTGTGEELFTGLLTNGIEAVIYTALFIIVTCVIVMGGISGGIEKFSKYSMPALAIMILIIIVRSLTLPGAMEGVAFMLVPNFDIVINDFWNVFRTAAGQMFFSLSLGMGCMMTYGSYLSKKENVEKNAFLIVILDTCVALFAGFMVIPAAFALNGEANSGPGLLFITMQDVFANMGAIGGIFGIVFYVLVFVAAITSSISLLEVIVTFFMDHAESKGKIGNRKQGALIASAGILVLATLTALNGLNAGSLGPIFGYDYLTFYDLWSEGIFMPLGAMFMSIMIGWELGIDKFSEEVEASGHKFKSKKFFAFCCKFIVPIAMVLVLISQLMDFGVIPMA